METTELTQSATPHVRAYLHMENDPSKRMSDLQKTLIVLLRAEYAL